MTRASAAAIVSSLLALAAGSACAQQRAADFPSKPMRVYVGLAPGGPTDIVARMVGSWLERRWKQPVVVENRPGANTALAIEAVKSAPADGHTLMANTHQFAARPYVSKNFPYRWETDSTPIGLVGGSGYILFSSTNVPPRTLREFLDYAKANPGKLNHAVIGSPVIETLDLLARNGAVLVNVPYKGGAPAGAAVLAGEAHFYNGDLMQATSFGQSGKLAMLAYTERTRHPSLPDVPTVAELGVYPDFNARFWVGIFGPAGLPSDIAEKIAAEIRELQKAPETIERFRSLGYQAYVSTPASMRQELTEIGRRNADIVKRLNIQPE